MRSASASTSTTPATRRGWVAAYSRTISPPIEWPTRTIGPRICAALSVACRSSTVSAAVRGIATGSLRLSARSNVTVPGRSYSQTRVSFETRPNTVTGWPGTDFVLQMSPRVRRPASRITVGAPEPLHSM